MFTATSQPNGKATHPKRKHSYQVALELQQLLLDDCRAKDTKPAVRAVCARTWDILEERKRVLRKVPMPKAIDVSQAKEQRRLARAARRPAEPAMIEAPTPPPATT
jgi:hypothetical protein